MATNYRTLSNAELVRAADVDPMKLVHPLFAELVERVRDPQRVYNLNNALAPVCNEETRGVRS
jgi:hypothetical protein